MTSKVASFVVAVIAFSVLFCGVAFAQLQNTNYAQYRIIGIQSEAGYEKIAQQPNGTPLTTTLDHRGSFLYVTVWVASLPKTESCYYKMPGWLEYRSCISYVKWTAMANGGYYAIWYAPIWLPDKVTTGHFSTAVIPVGMVTPYACAITVK